MTPLNDNPEPAAHAALRHRDAPRGTHGARQEDRRGALRQSEDTGQYTESEPTIAQFISEFEIHLS